MDEARLRLKVYLREAGDLPVVRERLTALLGQPGAEAVYLQADICRPELLMEVEGACPLGD